MNALNITGVTVFLVVVISATIAIKRNCPPPPKGPNLVLRRGVGVKTVYKHNDWLMYGCKERRFAIIGTTIRICKNGTWTGRTPTCQVKRGHRVRCKKIHYIRHGRVRGAGKSRVNSVVRFRCLRGYNLIGKSRLKCLKNGNWSAPVPKCYKDVSCPDPGTPTNGYRLGSSFKNGRTVRFSCAQKYKLKGSASRKCQKTRKWSGKPAKCVKIDPQQELKDMAENMRKNLVNKFSLKTTDGRARSGLSSGASGLDIVFVIDSSASVGATNFKRGIKFVQTIVNEFGVSTDAHGTRVAAVTFNTLADVKFNFNTKTIKDKDDVKDALDKIKYQGGGTNIEAALNKVLHVVANQARADSKKVLFLITDGRSNQGTNPKKFAERLREKKKFEIFTIGVTQDVDKRELEDIASKPLRSHVYLLADYKTLGKLTNMIVGKSKDHWECGLAGDTGLSGPMKTPSNMEAREDAWPWQAAIYADQPFKCGGALIADQWVLTAASCFRRKMINSPTKHNIKVILGEHNRLVEEGSEQALSVVRILRPKKYNKKDRDDLVLMKLQKPVNQTAYVHSICAAGKADSSLIWATHYGVITGWGSEHQGNNIPTIPANDQVYQTVVRFLSDRQCKKRSNNKLKGNVFCGTSKDDSIDDCLGDTGGPVVARRLDDTWALVGIMKTNEGCSSTRKHSIFTKVGHYAKWIQKTIKT